METPESILAHHGGKGMKWAVARQVVSAGATGTRTFVHASGDQGTEISLIIPPAPAIAGGSFFYGE